MVSHLVLIVGEDEMKNERDSMPVLDSPRERVDESVRKQRETPAEKLARYRARAKKLVPTQRGSAKEICERSLETFEKWRDVRKKASKIA